MIRVLIADDEAIVLEGLQCIIDWHRLGFSIVAECKNGEDAYQKIMTLQPDLVLMDIRMPKLHGTEVIRLCREASYKGHFIILSGYSDFQYAQTAIRYGVDYYLTKPLDEDELTNSVLEVKEIITRERQKMNALIQYKEKAKTAILSDILTGKSDFYSLDLDELHYNASVYQVVIYERYSQETFPAWYNFADLLRVSNQDNSTFDDLAVNEQNIIILKGSFALSRFQSLIDHYHKNVQSGSPLASIFLTYGPTVYKVDQICQSYEAANKLINRRFFCKENQHVLSYDELPGELSYTWSVQSEEAADFQKLLTSFIQIQNRNKIAETLHTLENNLFYARESITEIKHYLTDIYLQIKQSISHKYSTIDIPFPANTFVIQYIESKYFLYEIILFFSEQFDIIMNAISNPSGENVLQDVLNYIEINYGENLKLENISHLFGYNSSYLGKIFSQKIGTSFNSYVDQVRIRHSKELLADKSLKVYEIASVVGYKNVDYFHKKFKKLVNMSPAEYRKTLTDSF